MSPRYSAPINLVAANNRFRRRKSGSKKPATGPGIFTLYAGAQSGRIESVSNNNYSDASEGVESVSAFAGDQLRAGQYYNFDPSDIWIVYQTFLDFDTSSVVGTITNVQLSIAASTVADPEFQSIYGFYVDYGSTLTASDFVPYSILSGLVPVGYREFGTYGANLDAYISLQEVFPGNLAAGINKTGHTRVLLVAERNYGGAEPYQEEWVVAYPYDDATFKPKLVVTTI